MKTVITIIFIIFIGFTAKAANGTDKVKLDTLKTELTTPAAKDQDLARVYKFKNSRIKKALSFSTKRNKAKLA